MIKLLLLTLTLVIGSNNMRPNFTSNQMLIEDDKPKHPIVTLFHKRFDVGKDTTQQAWYLSIKLSRPAASNKNFEVWWKWNENDWQQPITIRAGETFATVETMTPYAPSDTIPYVHLYEGEKRVKATIKVLR